MKYKRKEPRECGSGDDEDYASALVIDSDANDDTVDGGRDDDGVAPDTAKDDRDDGFLDDVISDGDDNGDGDVFWVCHKCRHETTVSRKRCAACQAWRGGKMASSWSAKGCKVLQSIASKEEEEGARGGAPNSASDGDGATSPGRGGPAHGGGGDSASDDGNAPARAATKDVTTTAERAEAREEEGGEEKEGKEEGPLDRKPAAASGTDDANGALEREVATDATDGAMKGFPSVPSVDRTSDDAVSTSAAAAAGPVEPTTDDDCCNVADDGNDKGTDCDDTDEEVERSTPPSSALDDHDGRCALPHLLELLPPTRLFDLLSDGIDVALSSCLNPSMLRRLAPELVGSTMASTAAAAKGKAGPVVRSRKRRLSAEDNDKDKDEAGTEALERLCLDLRRRYHESLEGQFDFAELYARRNVFGVRTLCRAGGAWFDDTAVVHGLMGAKRRADCGEEEEGIRIEGASASPPVEPDHHEAMNDELKRLRKRLVRSREELERNQHEMLSLHEEEYARLRQLSVAKSRSRTSKAATNSNAIVE